MSDSPSDHRRSSRCPSEVADDARSLQSSILDAPANDELVRLVAMQLDVSSDSIAARSERLLQWQAVEERRRREAGDVDGSHRDRVRQIAHRVQAAADCVRLPLIRHRGRPVLRERSGATLLAKVIEPGPASSGSRPQFAPRVDFGVAAGVGRDLWDEPCDSWIELPEGMPAGRYIGLGVSGDSMEPLMHTGDTILVRVGADVQLNTVIVARHPDDGYVVKRVDCLTPTMIQLASLNVGYPLLAIPRDPSLIVGTVVLRWCAHEPRDESEDCTHRPGS